MFFMFMHSFEDEYERDLAKHKAEVYERALVDIANIHVNQIMSSIDIARAALRKGKKLNG